MKTIHSRIKQARIDSGLTQAQVADRLGVSPQSVQQWESSTAPRRNRLVALCSILGVDSNWVLFGGDAAPPSNNISELPESEYAFIPQYSDHGESGSGKENEHVEINGSMSFKKSWLSSVGLKPQNLTVIYADGDSMSPTISDSAVVLIDHSQAHPPVEGKVYVIRRDGNALIIKRLFRTSEGWVYKSDNPNKATYPDLTPLDNDDIIGRVVWQGGNNGL
ncbi:hypothetical protein QQ39_06515 [Pragia fontium]|nr:hypothetical protein QQ39_06515 [Pragia fontium]